MATAVLDLELSRFPTAISGLEPHGQALLIMRLHGRPIGKALLPVVDGSIGESTLQHVLSYTIAWPLLEQWMYNYLGWHEGRVPTKEPATIAVCTRDRPEDLRRCLDAVAKLPDDGQEYLVVDNCPSTAETRQIVEQYPQVRYIVEQRAGLNVARNRALREARHDIVAFVDDDAVPDPQWLRALLSNFGESDVLCVTGLTLPSELETEAQECFERFSSFERGFERRMFDGTHWNPLRVGAIGAGVNMAVRRSVLHLVGPFDEVLDAGTPTLSGGDHEMFSRILAAGYRIVYEPTALVWHRHRRTGEELRQTLYGYGVGVYASWTRSLLVRRELGIFEAAASWFYHEQFPALVRTLLGHGNTLPWHLLRAQLRGCAAGPRAYFVSRRRRALQRIES